MNILYHTHLYNPKLQIYEAVAQEISFLRKHFPGPVIQIDREGLLYDHLPGWLVKKRIAQLEKDVDLNHIYYPALIDKPYFRFLKKPIVYSVVAPQNESRIRNYELKNRISILFKKIDRIIVSDRRDVELLKKFGIENARAILPGIDLSRFTASQVKSTNRKTIPLTLLMASPPWRKHQFEDKGINLLLKFLEENLQAQSSQTHFATPNQIHITFLWRGRLYNKMKRLIKKAGSKSSWPNQLRNINQMVKVISRIIDPNEELAKVHGTIAVFPNASTAKAYPHSLIESLAAGKPVIISKNIYMADLIEKENCGVVVEPNLRSLKKGMDKFIQNYDEYQSNCRRTAEKYFSREKFLEEYKEVYESVINLKH